MPVVVLLLLFQRPQEEKYPVGPWLLALFVFVVCGSGVNISTCTIRRTTYSCHVRSVSDYLEFMIKSLRFHGSVPRVKGEVTRADLLTRSLVSSHLSDHPEHPYGHVILEERSPHPPTPVRSTSLPLLDGWAVGAAASPPPPPQRSPFTPFGPGPEAETSQPSPGWPRLENGVEQMFWLLTWRLCVWGTVREQPVNPADNVDSVCVCVLYISVKWEESFSNKCWAFRKTLGSGVYVNTLEQLGEDGSKAIHRLP